MKILDFLKTIYKRHFFVRNSVFGKNLTTGPHSYCDSTNKHNICIGNNCEILGTLCCVGNGKITIGNHSEIRTKSFVGSVENIYIGNYVIISNHVTIYDNNNHPTEPLKRKQMCIDGFYGEAWSWVHSDHRPVVIEDNVWIGEYSTILKGVTIGRGSIVGCHSVVTKDVPPYSIVAGNPAKVVKKIED